jgi:hypothetical protein
LGWIYFQNTRRTGVDQQAEKRARYKLPNQEFNSAENHLVLDRTNENNFQGKVAAAFQSSLIEEQSDVSDR